MPATLATLVVLFAVGCGVVKLDGSTPSAELIGATRSVAIGSAVSGSAVATAHASAVASDASTETSTVPTGAALPEPIARLTPRASGRLVTGPGTMPVPILMYHVVAVVPARTHDFGLYVTPRDFVAQLSYLADHGYQAVTLRQVYDFWHGEGTLPARPVVLSFDDGYPSDFDVVAPLLSSLHWPGVLDLIAGRGAQTRMPTAQVRTMIARGWEIDSHTVSHVDLTKLDPTRLTHELVASRTKLRALFGVPVDFFCYPSGRFDSKVVAAVRAAHYLGATTTEFGDARPAQMFTLKRIRVSGGESLAHFAAQLVAAR